MAGRYAFAALWLSASMIVMGLVAEMGGLNPVRNGILLAAIGAAVLGTAIAAEPINRILSLTMMAAAGGFFVCSIFPSVVLSGRGPLAWVFAAAYLVELICAAVCILTPLAGSSGAWVMVSVLGALLAGLSGVNAELVFFIVFLAPLGVAFAGLVVTAYLPSDGFSDGRKLAVKTLQIGLGSYELFIAMFCVLLFNVP